MTIPTSNASLGDIQKEFGGPTPIVLGNYYAGGAYVPNPPPTSAYQTGPIPTSGPISIGNFFGVSAVPPGPPLPTSPLPTQVFNISVGVYGQTAGYGAGDGEGQYIVLTMRNPNFVYYDTTRSDNGVSTNWTTNASGPALNPNDWQYKIAITVTGDTYLAYLYNDTPDFVNMPGSNYTQSGVQIGLYQGDEAANTGSFSARCQVILRRKSDGALYYFADLTWNVNVSYLGPTDPNLAGSGGG